VQANGRGGLVRVLDAGAVAEWAARSVRALQVLRPDIDGINVYPVADSDTGSNMLHTLTGAYQALSGAGPVAGAGAALRVLARGAVRAARGNSGVILSQVLRGFAEAVGDRPEVDGRLLCSALVGADRAATEAVAHPVDGTMLSVLHAVAEHVRPSPDNTLDDVVAEMTRSAAAALERTPHQLPVLAVAGVVDAGGRGLVAVLDALAAVVAGAAPAPAHSLTATAPPGQVEPLPMWEVMYQLDEVADDELVSLRRALSRLGDSVTVAGDGAGCHAVHVHCADIGAAIEAGLALGTPRRVRVEPLLTPGSAPVARVERAVAAVVHGDGLAELIRGEGVPVLAVPAGTSPSAEELLGLVTETAASHVTVLPASPALTNAVDAVAGHPMLEDRDVVVVPCSSPVQVLSAIAVHDASRRINDDVVAMAEAAAATRRGELLVARQESITWVGRAHAGDVVGLVDDEVVHIEAGPPGETVVVAAALGVLERLLALGGELVTVLAGAQAPEGILDVLTDRLCAAHPEIELVCYSSGQQDSVLLIGVE
jgi:DAK2 domain fusion protein YloV